ncbi:MAG: hypothetical protein R3C68_12290 [Myxococcota bacterium]
MTPAQEAQTSSILRPDILIVDDDTKNHIALGATLEGIDLNLTFASSRKGAAMVWEQAESSAFGSHSASARRNKYGVLYR